jgi:hypothetical protein
MQLSVALSSLLATAVTAAPVPRADKVSVVFYSESI